MVFGELKNKKLLQLFVFVILKLVIKLQQTVVLHDVLSPLASLVVPLNSGRNSREEIAYLRGWSE